MERLHDNVDYKTLAKCDHCGHEFNYHITDVKGLDPKYVMCPVCGQPVKI